MSSTTIDIDGATIDYSASTDQSDPSVEKQSLPYTTHTIALSNGLLTPHNHDESHHTLESTELSDGEGDIEIENLDTGFDTSAQMGSSNVSCRGKRTVINLWQKAILEDFFRNGMNSASMQLLAHHTAAAEKTGLDCEVVKNWIRNRRRPAAARTAEKLASIISTTNAIPPNLLNLPAVPPISIGTSSISAASLSTTTVPLLSAHTPPSLTEVPADLSPPPAKRPHMERSAVNPATVHQVFRTVLSHTVQVDTQLIVKVRLSEIDADDFVEVELPSLSYQSLFTAVCEELELAPSNVAKIRKLPNVLVRKDKDVLRLKEGQELEVVLNSNYVRASIPSHIMLPSVHNSPYQLHN